MNRHVFSHPTVSLAGLAGWAISVWVVGCAAGNDQGGGGRQDGQGGGGTLNNAGGESAAGGLGGGGQAGQVDEPTGGVAGGDPFAGGVSGSGSGGAPAGGATNMGGAGGSLPGTGGTQPAAGCATALFCDDFEKPGKGARPAAPLSTGINSGDSLAIDDTRAFSGTKSVRIVANKAGSTAMSLAVKDLLPSAKKVAYARMMLWMENRPGNNGHWDVMTLQGPAMGGGETWVSHFSFGGFGDNKSKLLYFSTSSAGGLADCSKSGSPQIPLGQWVCVEMAVDETAAAHYTVKVNDKVIPNGSFRDASAGSTCCCGSTNNNTWYVPDVLSVKFGWAQAHEQLMPVTFWIDDIAVGEKPIGCPRM